MTKSAAPVFAKPDWDYSYQAPYYQYRPNYSPKAIDVLLTYVNPQQQPIKVADVGAGTGNLSVLLEERHLSVTAVEPTDAMREIGIERTQGTSIQWVKADGTNTTLPSNTYHWVTFGSSFNVLDRNEALRETARILVPQGYFSCLWNHRNLDDPIQNEAESIILKYVPGYERGVRREEQRPILEESQDFKDIFYLEMDFEFQQTRDAYLKAWRSVKNRFWDFSTEEGRELFGKIESEMTRQLPETFSVQYTTRAWTVQKVK